TDPPPPPASQPPDRQTDQPRKTASPASPSAPQMDPSSALAPSSLPFCRQSRPPAFWPLFAAAQLNNGQPERDDRFRGDTAPGPWPSAGKFGRSADCALAGC